MFEKTNRADKLNAHSCQEEGDRVGGELGPKKLAHSAASSCVAEGRWALEKDRRKPRASD